MNERKAINLGHQPDVMVFIVPEKLTDGSIVHNIQIGSITLHATSEEAANDFVDAFLQIIDEHTVDSAGAVRE